MELNALKLYHSIKSAKLKKIMWLLLIIFVIISFVFIKIVWDRSIKHREESAIQLAETFEAGLHKCIISELNADESDLNKIEYKEIKNSLVRLVEKNHDIRFAYILIEKEGKIKIMADSEPVSSKDYSPPGQDYTEANKEVISKLENGQTIILNPVKDRWGTWVSVLVPMKNIETGDTIAVFGIDYPAESWNNSALERTLQVTMVMFCLLVILIMLNIAYYQNTQLYDEKKKLSIIDDKLQKSEKLFKAIFDQAPMGIAIGHNGRFSSIKSDNDMLIINSMGEKILGRNVKELKYTKWSDITHPDDLEFEMELFTKFISGEIDGYEMEKRYIKPDNTEVWVNKKISRLMINNLKEYNHLCIIEDISKRKKIEKDLIESERSKAVLLNNLPGMAYRCNYDREWTMQFVSAGCYELTGYEPESLINNKDISFNDLISPVYQDNLYKEWERVINHKLPFRYEYEIITAQKKIKWVMEIGQVIYDSNDNVEALEGIVFDITDRKDKEAKIQYMNDHDYLTGLYNRKYFEEFLEILEKENCNPVSILIADINGIKMINNAFGFAEGDKLIIKVNEIIKDCVREGYVLARTGGDEFTVVMPNANSKIVEEIIDKVYKACMDYNKNSKTKLYEISISIGSATKVNNDIDIFMLLKKADEDLRNKKFLNRKSTHSNIITSMLATVYEKSTETEAHSKRLGNISKVIGETLCLSNNSLSELQLLAMIHDIGKVGIDERVLNKPSKLNDEEWAIMKKHPEIGYRIAKSAYDLEHVADYILYHHERWDGKGYPSGLKGEEIPLPSRIIAVADAYDAMTQDRVYRKALTKEHALNEIRKNAGTQFDPIIAQSFIDNASLL